MLLGRKNAFEMRHASWFSEAVYELLAARGIAWCIADSETLTTAFMLTAPYSYLRLRDEGYTGEDIIRWARDIRQKAAGCEDVYVYYKHESSGKGAVFARQLIVALGEPAP